MLNKTILSLAVVLAGLSANALASEREHSYQSGAFDLVVADEQRLIQMLKKSGKIAQGASFNEAEVALRSFLKTRQQQEALRAASLDAEATSNFAMDSDIKSSRKKVRRSKGDKKGKFSRSRRNRPDNLVIEDYSGEARQGRVLAILMEFPDFPHNSILPEDSGMYYEDYNQDHYRQILFGAQGWIAPNGHHANSFTQFYEKQSGGSYSLTGDVAGWYMATENAAYYGGNPDGDARSLIREALAAAAADPSVDLTQFDIEDRYDLDGDGNYWEADGLVDHVMVFHSSVGEEAGGGQLGEDAIWAHRWNLGGVWAIPGATSDVPYWNGAMVAYDYTIAPIDSAVGIISHEFGHDLGLPDEYDTQYTGKGEPVSMWSVMSSGSWAGRLGGTEPTGFSAWAKEQLQASLGGNWLHGATVNFDDIPRSGIQGLLDQASSKGTNHDAIRINLPQKQSLITTPVSGQYAYFSGSGNDLDNRMSTRVDLTAASSVVVKFKTWYDIEADWDYAYLAVSTEAGLVTIANALTTDTNPNGNNLGNGITGSSNGWIDAEFDLTSFAGQVVDITVIYSTDPGVANAGIYIDDFSVELDSVAVVTANADDSASEPFNFAGFTANTGSNYTDHYYLLEWRTHHGVDSGLAHINVAGETMSYEEGLLIWYVDNKFSDNWVGNHPGDGFLGVVDADQKTLKWSDGAPASTKYQIHDATFSIDRNDKMFLDLEEQYGITLRDNRVRGQRLFNDRRKYIGSDIPDAGRNIPTYGLKIRLINQSKDRSVGSIYIYR
ncbi:immune inhibitor A domain-containing protein [Shewanella violacea]|uniref:Immune inhibitor A-like metalloprotease n=1 Tax=Shewanella violacea (strain JCM 10179 / CIP 106290 / LMG 19151 / DSS12) TaxID=637905 RepID=D4ZAN1_SHEVD|nr:immune inhibitor A domain-containing protein [Shewanella violacea]BAJ03076.1 immune inhibitor A-like metalloprotease [Shewanella violacea DSS12]